MTTSVKNRDTVAKKINDEFRSFRKSALVFSSNRKRLISSYPEKWVAVHNGTVVAHDANYDTVLKTIDTKKIPRKLVLVRFIAKKPCTMVL